MVITFLDVETHKEPDSEVRFWLSTTRKRKWTHKFIGLKQKPTICMSQIIWLMIVFLTHSRKRLERLGRQKTSEDISGLSRTHEIGNFNFRFWPLGGARKNIFWLHHCDQNVTISNPTNFDMFPILITLILKTRLRRVETLPMVVYQPKRP